MIGTSLFLPFSTPASYQPVTTSIDSMAFLTSGSARLQRDGRVAAIAISTDARAARTARRFEQARGGPVGEDGAGGEVVARGL